MRRSSYSLTSEEADNLKIKQSMCCPCHRRHRCLAKFSRRFQSQPQLPIIRLSIHAKSMISMTRRFYDRFHMVLKLSSALVGLKCLLCI